MNRRGFVQRSLLLGGGLTSAEAMAAAQIREPKPRPAVIDVHGHAGRG
jgi:hypothetical protein